MKPQSGPTSKPPISINTIHETVADLPDEMEICALVSPVGFQVQFFYEDFSLEKVLYGLGVEPVDITHVIFQTEHIPQHAMSSFIQDNITEGAFDVSGVLYISLNSFLNINKFRAENGHPTFRYVESALSHILNTYEFAEELRFTPNWSDSLVALSCIDKYQTVLEVLSADFDVMENIICTVKTIDNIEKLKHNVLHVQYSKDIADFPKQSIILFKNDISKIKRFISAESNIITEVFINDTPDKIKIEAIEAEADRFGRIRPVISSDEITKYEYEFYTIELPTMADLVKAQYRVGDVVEVSFINKIPRLGRIIERTKSPNKNPFLKEECYCCGTKLVYQQGSLYCTKPTCASVVFYKMLYAKSKRVLDLPFDWHALHDLVMLRGALVDIPSLFNLDRTSLMSIFDTDLVDIVLNTLRTRIAQLNGDGFGPEIQNVTQGRFLDALSIVGLHSQNIKRLQKSLAEGDWHWSELPLVLTNWNLLNSFKIPTTDILQIIRSASSKIQELDTLVRDF